MTQRKIVHSADRADLCGSSLILLANDSMCASSSTGELHKTQAASLCYNVYVR